ncbi:thiamine-phosphate pyrophosphorylase [Sesbania bispinosa]|nr:thiamine-phosphate pyrophosphorylase [Sesbania bispinosa]
MAVSRRTRSGREGLGATVQCGCGGDMHGGSRLADRGDVICYWDDGGGGWRCTEARVARTEARQWWSDEQCQSRFPLFPLLCLLHLCYPNSILLSPALPSNLSL